MDFKLLTIVTLTGLSALFFVVGTRLFFRQGKEYEAREVRRLVNIPIKVRLNGQTLNFFLVDISRHGAKINHAKSIQSHETIDIRLGGVWYPAQIRWHNRLFAGIKFDKLLKPKAFIDLTEVTHEIEKKAA